MTQPSVTSVFKKKSDYKVAGSLWIECDRKRFFGPGRVELLQKIEETGSINKAAKQMDMSYKKAREMISDLNAHTSKPFVITQTGGSKGGGSIITTEAKKLIVYHKKLRERFLNFLDIETKKLSPP